MGLPLKNFVKIKASPPKNSIFLTLPIKKSSIFITNPWRILWFLIRGGRGGGGSYIKCNSPLNRKCSLFTLALSSVLVPVGSGTSYPRLDRRGESQLTNDFSTRIPYEETAKQLSLQLFLQLHRVQRRCVCR